MDDLLFQTKGPNPTVFWRPGNGRQLTHKRASYQPFQQVVRTVHVQDALQICVEQRMQPKPVFTRSILNKWCLQHTRHPCKYIQVLWFGTEPPSVPGNENKHDWYGNIQFAVPAAILLERWKYCYLVEIMTAKTHTTSRLLITNTNYSGVLPQYNPHQVGGPWLVNSNGHFVLPDCSRFNDEGFNRNGHNLEFMIEVTPRGQRSILDECVISFRNHSRAMDPSLHLRCHRNQFSNQMCPSPVTSAIASRMFFDQHERIASVSPVATPSLSENAENYRKCYFMMINNVSPSRQSLSSLEQYPALQSRRPPPIPRGPSSLQTHFPNPPNPYPMESLEHFSTRVFQQVGNNSRLFTHQTMQGPWGENRECWSLQQTTNHHNMQYWRGQASWGEREEHLRREREHHQRLDQAGHDPRVYAQQNTPPLPASLKGTGEQRQIWSAWWFSLNDYCRGVLMWFWSQEQHHDALPMPGWPTHQQHQHQQHYHHQHHHQRPNRQRIQNNFE